QWQALLWLSRRGGALMQRELADALEIGAPATVALVDRMERDGLVARSAVPGDRRRNAVVLTPRARRLLTKLALRLSPRSVLILIGTVIAAVAVAWYWHESSLRQRTEDAYVNAKIVQ